MPTLRSHTHLQATQANAQTKACKRVCLPNRTDTATWDSRETTEKEGRTHNSGLAKGGLTCFVETFVQGSAFMLRMNLSTETPALRQAANR